MSDPTTERLEEQIIWYDRRSNRAQLWFKGLKIVELGSAALIPFLAELQVQKEIVAALGVLIVILEGAQHLNQYHHNWITYRSTCEHLKHEKYLFLGGAGPYAKGDNPARLLAERVESLVSQEHAKWTSAQRSSKEIAGSGR